MCTRGGPFRSPPPPRPVRSGEPQSTTTATSYFEPSSSKTTVPAPGRKRRLPGTGSAFSTVAVFPMFLRARASASSDPMASPSGFSWQATRKRSFSRRTRQIAERSPLIRHFLPLRDSPADRGAPGAAVVPGSVMELQVGGVPKVEEMAQFPPQETGGTAKGLGHGRGGRGGGERGGEERGGG